MWKRSKGSKLTPEAKAEYDRRHEGGFFKPKLRTNTKELREYMKGTTNGKDKDQNQNR